MKATLDLRPLTEPQRLAAINEAVAVHVSKLENLHWIDHVRVYGGAYPDVRSLPDYATSADAVLPLLDKFFYIWSAERDSYMPTEEAYSAGTPKLSWCTAPTLALACCFLLLRAHGVEVIQS